MADQYYQYDPFLLSSVCPSSCALVAFAARLGGTIDPEFLQQCKIMDPKFEKAIASLKPVPLNFQNSYTSNTYQEDIFLDIAVDNSRHFYDPYEFKQYNSWLGSPEQWNSTYGHNNDIVIDFF